MAILLGFLGFSFFRYVPASQHIRFAAVFLVDSLPFFLFLILFFAFCKLNLKEMSPKRWHLLLGIIQVVCTAALVAIAVYADLSENQRLLVEGAIICSVAPTAASAAVITGKLGGNESAQTTYTIISNIIAAVLIPLFFPLFCSSVTGEFLSDFVLILRKIFPILVLPLILALLVKRFLPYIHSLILKYTKDAGFYLWLATLSVQSARIFESIADSQSSFTTIVLLFIDGLVCTVILYALGKYVGSHDNQRISAGQGLGQKNTIFAIWVAILYISPTVAIVPSSYLLWQNLVNAWQLARRQKLIEKAKEDGVAPYQE